jgi:hypothetical protein
MLFSLGADIFRLKIKILWDQKQNNTTDSFPYNSEQISASTFRIKFLCQLYTAIYSEYSVRKCYVSVNLIIRFKNGFSPEIIL